MPRRRAGGVLPVVAGLFVMSAAVRLVGDAAPVLAQESAVPSPEEGASESPVRQESGPQLSPLLIEALREREARVADRETRLADRVQALSVAEAEIVEKLDALQAAEESLAEMLALASSAAESDLSRLTEVYENMKSQEAAALFETMEPAFAAGFMGRMQPEAAAAIMSNLAPETAYLISVVLAGRNAGAPTE